MMITLYHNNFVNYIAFIHYKLKNCNGNYMLNTHTVFIHIKRKDHEIFFYLSFLLKTIFVLNTGFYSLNI